MQTRSLRSLADVIGRGDAEAARVRWAPALGGEARALEIAALLASAYPALDAQLQARPDVVIELARPRERTDLRRTLAALLPPLEDVEGVRRVLRRFSFRERARVALRELYPGSRSDVDVTSRELSDLAEVLIDAALREALAWADARFGAPRTEAGERCPVVVIGMGKLGGRELNAGSDVDLLLFYETDEGQAGSDTTLHEYFTRVAQRFTATLDEPTEHGVVWRVDLRLRPEGSRGPLVNALAAAERYYETWGRTWERAALLRARPVAGDAAFGERLLSALAPFVWRREVRPQIADEMHGLIVRARTELGVDPARDLKHGPGGIREAEFFVQSLQLVWGGRDPDLRVTNTLEALARLRAGGFVTDREAREIETGYLALRRLEHRVQVATGLQTHSVPTDPSLLERIARSLGFDDAAALEADLARVRSEIGECMGSLLVAGGAPQRDEAAALTRLFAALDADDEPAVLEALRAPGSRFVAGVDPAVAPHLVALARRPDAPLGARTRDEQPELATTLLDAIADAADPEQASRLLAAFFARFSTPTVYVRAFAADPRAVRRATGVFGASAFLGQEVVQHPELADRLLFGHGAPTAESAASAVREELRALGDEAPDVEAFVGALRRAKRNVTMEVGLADLAGELDMRACTLALSALADASVEQATRYALAERGVADAAGLTVIAMGKLGGLEIGYGSDLDLIFVYADEEDVERMARVAQRVLRILGAPHGEGHGYELDTRLRPSGNQGLLVVSLSAFEQYQASRAHDWERQALVKARFCGGDAALGDKVAAIAHVAAYERGAPPAEDVHRLRMRMQTELSGERPGRYDVKLGRGGLVDVEFTAQWLQMKHGHDARVRTTETEIALGALEACGYLDRDLAAPLLDGWRTLRRIEQRARVHHGTSAPLLEEGAPGLAVLARRLGMRDGPRGSAADALLAHYVAVTTEVRAAYLAVLGLHSEG